MNLNTLKKFAQGARRKLLSEVASRLEYLLSHDDAYVRSHQGELAEIRRQLQSKGRDQLVEEVAYTWFNRIVALRYMDLRGYTKVRVVSPQAGQVQPELLFQIKQGRTPAELQPLQSVFDGYLNGTVKSDQPDREIYTAALLGICNDYSRTLPFLFRQVDEYMAVLLPTDLLSESSILTGVQGAIGEDDVQDVEVIGWLYQFYISEKKDQVFGRPKGEKIRKEDIPAATQLFTPHWIVRYMVENSLGRLWRNNRPDTGLKEQMEYYIEGDPEREFLTIEGPQEITLLDPACGSGHILTYAFDLLYGMYEEAGYSAEEIPSLILTNNLYGIDIDTRAAELASFALTMKAREKDRFFFKRGVVPRVIAMEDVSVDLREADIKMSPQLQEAFGYLSEATNFGSLIPVPAEVQGEIEDLLADLDARGDADLFADQAMTQVGSGLRQLGYLAKRYHCVVTNPPYMNARNLNRELSDSMRSLYTKSKEDLFSLFISRAIVLLTKMGISSLVTMESWMFLSSFDETRKEIMSKTNIISLVHMPYLGKGHTSMRINFETAAFCFVKTNKNLVRGYYSCVRHFETDSKGVPLVFPTRNEREAIVPQSEFKSIAGAPISYWMRSATRSVFRTSSSFSEIAISAVGLQTGDTELFLRTWQEISSSQMYSRWYPIAKGGGYRKWYGNHIEVVDWENEGERIKSFPRSYPRNAALYFKEGLVCSAITSGPNSYRNLPKGFVFDVNMRAIFPKDGVSGLYLLALLSSKVVFHLLSFLSPTMAVNTEDFDRLPIVFGDSLERVVENTLRLLEISRQDWDSSEQSWEFSGSPLLSKDCLQYSENGKISQEATNSDFITASRETLLESAYNAYCQLRTTRFQEMLSLEEDNNRTFIELYGLNDELTPEIPFSEITILQNELDPRFRSQEKVIFKNQELMKQFVSYGVGCIFGRYSLDKDGLILANAGDGLDVYLAQIPEPTLRPDESGILPITDDNDFADDLPSQWRAFLRAAFGNEHYEENLHFLEDGLGKRLRPYFLKGFYDDHVKRYKKRPIYWLITSPKGTLQALIYLHRYNRDTVNRFLNDYLRPYQQKLEAKRVSAEHVLTGGGSSQSEKTKAQKRIDEIRKALEELSTWERDVVRPLAEKRIELDLDDGVKVNYGKLGAILAKVKGLNA
jgi:uncharacterized protein (UPF0297 family)